MRGHDIFQKENESRMIEGFIWLVRLIKKIPLLPDGGSEPLVYICDLAKEKVSGLFSQWSYVF